MKLNLMALVLFYPEKKYHSTQYIIINCFLIDKGFESL